MNETEFKESFLKFSQSAVLKQHASKATDGLIGGLGETNTRLEAEESVAVATAKIWEKIEAGKFNIPTEITNPDGFWMEQFKQHIKHFLLKRYARRSNTKPAQQYEKDCDQLKALGIKNPKPLKYDGARFEQSQDEVLKSKTQLSPEELLLLAAETETKLRSQLVELGLDSTLIDLVVMRTEGMTYKEIGEKLDKSEDAIRQRLSRGVKRAGLTRKEVLNLD